MSSPSTSSSPPPLLPLQSSFPSPPPSPPQLPSKLPSDAERPPHIRIVPHLGNIQSLQFSVIDQDLPNGVFLKIGRSTGKVVKNRIAFRSKVVSRGHAEIWTENGKFYIRDTESSSGTFLNNIRLSPPKLESQPFVLNDGDIVQLGVDYQGGTEEIYRCVKMRLEINRTWQQQANPFSQSTFQTLRSLIAPSNKIISPLSPLSPSSSSSPSSSTSSSPSSPSSPLSLSTEAPPQTATNVEEPTECCICLYAIAPRQALFIAPCSHIFHYKCIRPLLLNHPGFMCPLCRTYADLEQDVAIEEEQVKVLDQIGKALVSGSEDQVQYSSQLVDDNSQPSLPLCRNRRSLVIEKFRTAMFWDNKKPLRSPGKSPSPRQLDLEDEFNINTDTPAGPSTPGPTRGHQPKSDGYPFPNAPSLHAANDTKDEDISTSSTEELEVPNGSAIKQIGGGGKGKERATDQGLGQVMLGGSEI